MHPEKKKGNHECGRLDCVLTEDAGVRVLRACEHALFENRVGQMTSTREEVIRRPLTPYDWRPCEMGIWTHG